MSKLFLGNIPHSFSEADITQWIESFGYRVESVDIIRDRVTGNSRGFGFARLDQETNCHDAIPRMNGQRIGSRVLTVGEAEPFLHEDEKNSAA